MKKLKRCALPARTSAEGIYDKGSPPDCFNWKPGGDPIQVRKLDNCWKADRTIAAAVLSERLGYISAQLIGAPSIRMWHDQFLHKPARGGKVVTYHQDWAYWQAIDVCKTVTCWIALDDVRADSGPMVFLQGSHKHGLFPLPKGISGDDVQFPVLPAGMKCKEVPVIIPAGHVSFHHGLTLHGSGHNTSSNTRRAMVSHLMSGECRLRDGYGHHNLDWMKKYSSTRSTASSFTGRSTRCFGRRKRNRRSLKASATVSGSQLSDPHPAAPGQQGLPSLEAAAPSSCSWDRH